MNLTDDDDDRSRLLGCRLVPSGDLDRVDIVRDPEGYREVSGTRFSSPEETGSIVVLTSKLLATTFTPSDGARFEPGTLPVRDQLKIARCDSSGRSKVRRSRNVVNSSS